MELPDPIIWAVAISIIVIGLAILIKLVIYLIAGSVLMKKVSQLTESIDSLVGTLNEKTSDIGDQASATIKTFNEKINSESEKVSDTKKWVDITTKVIAMGTIVLKFAQMFKKSNGGN
jgi:predicted PurR-regulated permease PerM